MVVKGVNFKSVVFAGLVAGYLMNFVSFWFAGVFGLFGGPMAGYIATGNLPAVLPHLADAIIFGVVYAGFVRGYLKGPEWLRGTIFGVILWVAVGATAMAAVALGGETFKMMTTGGNAMMLTSLALHVLYGFVLGALYNPEAR